MKGSSCRYKALSFLGRSANVEHNHVVTARRAWRDYRIDWVAGVPTDVQDPLAMGDGRGFLESLVPGDKIALWARAEVRTTVAAAGYVVLELTFAQQQAWVNRVAGATIEVGFDAAP